MEGGLGLGLPTRAVLRGRGVDLLLICPWCQLEEEGHVLFLCPKARQIWRMVGFTLGGVQLESWWWPSLVS